MELHPERTFNLLAIICVHVSPHVWYHVVDRLIVWLPGLYCENFEYTPSCGQGGKLKIYSAVFGRTNYQTCYSPQMYTASCKLDVTGTLQVRDANTNNYFPLYTSVNIM